MPLFIFPPKGGAKTGQREIFDRFFFAFFLAYSPETQQAFLVNFMCRLMVFLSLSFLFVSESSRARVPHFCEKLSQWLAPYLIRAERMGVHSADARGVVDLMLQQGRLRKRVYRKASQIKDSAQAEAFVSLLALQLQADKYLDLALEIENEVEKNRFMALLEQGPPLRYCDLWKQIHRDRAFREFSKWVNFEKLVSLVGSESLALELLGFLHKRFSQNEDVVMNAYRLARGNDSSRGSGVSLPFGRTLLRSSIKDSAQKLEVRLSEIRLQFELQDGGLPQQLDIGFARILYTVLAAILLLDEDNKYESIEIVAQSMVSRRLIGVLRTLGFQLDKDPDRSDFRLPIGSEINSDRPLGIFMNFVVRGSRKMVPFDEKYIEETLNKRAIHERRLLLGPG